eukprot:CAMPEP_0176056724 /NCGR_PEP_ID=MMETSP0120_2-20121206/28249_1 /TAXON_ID=160619 /ORGANISM="Kryptoperidinium foliaceum, Strain CCMP 1326" /LENGTH=372 /DNA_ID=CAMNT_0017390231 /DNA_START=90 /DNA_END=1208 /DNA_ORIENTATION=+
MTASLAAVAPELGASAGPAASEHQVAPIDRSGASASCDRGCETGCRSPVSSRTASKMPRGPPTPEKQAGWSSREAFPPDAEKGGIDGALGTATVSWYGTSRGTSTTAAENSRSVSPWPSSALQLGGQTAQLDEACSPQLRHAASFDDSPQGANMTETRLGRLIEKNIKLQEEALAHLDTLEADLAVDFRDTCEAVSAMADAIAHVEEEEEALVFDDFGADLEKILHEIVGVQLNLGDAAPAALAATRVAEQRPSGSVWDSSPLAASDVVSPGGCSADWRGGASPPLSPASSTGALADIAWATLPASSRRPKRTRAVDIDDLLDAEAELVTPHPAHSTSAPTGPKLDSAPGGANCMQLDATELSKLAQSWRLP